VATASETGNKGLCSFVAQDKSEASLSTSHSTRNYQPMAGNLPVKQCQQIAFPPWQLPVKPFSKGAAWM
jgi:hypothetical protein